MYSKGGKQSGIYFRGWYVTLNQKQKPKKKKKLRSITISVIQCVKRQVYVIAKVVKICWKGKMLKVHSVIYLKVVIISDFLISN